MKLHEIHRVSKFKIVSSYTLQIEFEDGLVQTINFQPVLAGEIYGPLRDLSLFNQVKIDPEVHTLVWPNGADFDPETLYHWQNYESRLIDMAKKWHEAAVSE